MTTVRASSRCVADYLRRNRPYTPKLDGRITEIGAAVAQPAEPAQRPRDSSRARAKQAERKPPPRPQPKPPPSRAAAALPAATTEAKPADAAANAHVIVAGDNFWDLAETFYGDGDQVADDRRRQPGNRPRTLQIGKTLTIPPASELNILATEGRARPACRAGSSFSGQVRPDVALNSTAQR